MEICQHKTEICCGYNQFSSSWGGGESRSLACCLQMSLLAMYC